MLVDGEGQRETMVENCRCRDGLKSPTQVISFRKKGRSKSEAGRLINLSLFLCLAVQTVTMGGFSVCPDNKECAGATRHGNGPHCSTKPGPALRGLGG